MLLGSIAAKALRDRTPAAAITAAVLAGFTLLGMWVSSSIGAAMTDLGDSMPDGLSAVMGLGSGDSYVIGELFGLLGPIAVLVVAISGGVAAIAGEERDRTAGLLLTLPVSRDGVVRSKAAALLGDVTIVCGALAASSSIGALLTGTELSFGHALAGSVHLFCFGAAFAMFALALSAGTGSVGRSTSIAVGVAVVTNLAGSLLPLVKSLAWVRYLSPWHYYNGSDPVVDGMAWADVAVLVAAAAVGLAAALVAVRRRDLESVDRSRGFRLPAMARLTRPRLGSVLAKELSERSSLMIVATGYAAVVVFGIAALYPALENVLAKLQADLPPALGGFIGSDMASPAGWLNAEVMSVMAPLAVIGLASFVGARPMSSVGQRNPLSIVLAAPVKRRTIVAANLATSALTAVAVSAGLALGTVLGSVAFGLDLPVSHVVGAAAHLALLGTAFGAFAVLAAAATSTGNALRATAGLAAVAYLANSLLPQASWGPPWVKLSPWYYYFGSEPLANGPDLGHLAVLALLGAACSAVAVWAYDRRDLAA